MNKIVVALVSAGVSASAAWFITKKYYENKMDILANSTVDEVQAMYDQLSELHRVFVEEQPIEVAESRQKTWDTIAKGVNSNVGRTDAEVVEEFRNGIINAQKDDEYSEIVREYSGESEQTEPKSNSNIFMITELEFNDMDPYHSKEELQLWMVEEGLYDESEEPVDACVGFLGITLEELISMADTHDNEYLYFRNENTSGDYSVHIHKDGYSNYFQSMSETDI